MKITAKHVEDIIVMDLTGEVNFQTVAPLKKSVELLISRGLYHIVLNFKPTKYVDSVGIGTLVGLQKKLNSYEGELCLVGVRPEILKAFEMVRLKKFFKQFNTKNEAIKYFQGGKSLADGNIDDILSEAKDILGMKS